MRRAMAIGTANRDREDLVTYRRMMQSVIGHDLRSRYPVPQKLSHELLVLMLRLEDREREAAQQRPRTAPVESTS